MRSMFRNVMPVSARNSRITHQQNNYTHYQFQNGPGNQLTWIILDLYRSQHPEKNMILIAIDRLIKMIRFIPTHNPVISKETTDLFLREIFRHHGLSSNIVSDHRFTTKFWEALQKALDLQLLISTVEDL